MKVLKNWNSSSVTQEYEKQLICYYQLILFSKSMASSVNPVLEGNSVNDMELIKGDRIGNTMYSERSVLSLLMEVTKMTEFSEQLEEQLSVLWDMTVEEDVSLFLFNNNFVDLATSTIMQTENERLIEMLVGIIGNMCCVKSVRKKLGTKRETVEMLMKLLGIRDVPTLVQLIRVFEMIVIDLITENEDGKKKDVSDERRSNCMEDSHTVSSCGEDFTNEQLWILYLRNVDLWFHHIPNILMNCVNSELINSLWHLIVSLSDVEYQSNLYLDKCFLSLELLNSLLESFHAFFKKSNPSSEEFSILMRKAANNWVDAMNCFINYSETTNILTQKFSEFVDCAQYLLNHFSHNYMSDIENNKIVMNTIKILQNVLTCSHTDFIQSNESLVQLGSITERLINRGSAESNSEWEDDATSINIVRKDTTMNSLKELLQSIRDLQLSNNID